MSLLGAGLVALSMFLIIFAAVLTGRRIDRKDPRG